MTATVTELPALSGPELRARVAAQLRAAADFLESTDVEIDPFAQAVIHFFAPSTEAVDREAAKFGAVAAWDDNHYVAKKTFGTGVAYKAVHICKGACRGGHEVPQARRAGSGEAA